MIINEEFDCNNLKEIIMVARIKGSTIIYVSLYKKEDNDLYKLICLFNDKENEIKEYISINSLKISNKIFIVDNYDNEYDEKINVQSLRTSVTKYILDNISNPFLSIKNERFQYAIDEHNSLTIYTKVAKLKVCDINNIFIMNLYPLIQSLKRDIDLYIKALQSFKYDLSDISYDDRYPTVFRFFKRDKELNIIKTEHSGDIGCMYYYGPFNDKCLDNIGIIYDDEKSLLCQDKLIPFNKEMGLIIGEIGETIRVKLSRKIQLLPDESRYYRNIIKMYYKYAK